MSFPGGILMGAQARLLDPTIPYRYFASALLFHILFWALIGLYPGDLIFFFGGSGPALATLHSLTLGILVMTAMGAAFQMLPVATGKPLRSTVAARIASWFFIPGTTILVGGMLTGEHIPMAIGGFSAAIGLVIFIVLIGELLWHARAMEPVASFGLTALAALFATLALGLLFLIDDDHGFLDRRADLSGIHFVVAVFGFMGMLTVGFSHVLIPLFTLSQGVPAGQSRAVFVTMSGALAGAVAGIYFELPLLTTLSGIAGLTGVGLHVRSMEYCIRTGMRKKLGIAGLLIRAGWVCLALALIAAIFTTAGFLDNNGFRYTIFIALFGWLLSFLLGVLQRILPFLGAMNATGAGTKPPRPSELAPEKLLRFHAAMHFSAIILVALGLGLENALAVRLGGLAGIIGAFLYAGFAARIWWLIHGHAK